MHLRKPEVRTRVKKSSKLEKEKKKISNRENAQTSMASSVMTAHEEANQAVEMRCSALEETGIIKPNIEKVFSMGFSGLYGGAEIGISYYAWKASFAKDEAVSRGLAMLE